MILVVNAYIIYFYYIHIDKYKITFKILIFENKQNSARTFLNLKNYNRTEL